MRQLAQAIQREAIYQMLVKLFPRVPFPRAEMDTAKLVGCLQIMANEGLFADDPPALAALERLRTDLENEGLRQ